jgi:hypothetical protein
MCTTLQHCRNRGRLESCIPFLRFLAKEKSLIARIAGVVILALVAYAVVVPPLLTASVIKHRNEMLVQRARLVPTPQAMSKGKY